jgi:uncharacterized protein with FMN-binding domain
MMKRFRWMGTVALMILCGVAYGQDPVAGEVTRTKAEVNKLIAEVGPTQPEWWEETPFNPPKTLDLTWANMKQKGWKPNHKMGTHLFMSCQPPGKWRYAIKLLHESLEKQGKRSRYRKETMEHLGTFYCRIGDRARGAYWWKKARVKGGPMMRMGMARCYWKLGDRRTAVAMLKDVRSGDRAAASAVRLWSEMDELKRALALAKKAARGRNKGWVLLAAGDACRRAGKWKDAAGYYARLSRSKPGRRLQALARESEAAMKAMGKVDLAKIKDGVYEGSGSGFVGPITVSVTVKAGRIEAVKVTKQRENRAISALRDVPRGIVDAQGVAGVDAVSGATISSNAVANGVASALADGMK